MNFLSVKKFTDLIYDLFVVQNITFSEALSIMKGSSDRKISMTARFICVELEKGALLSEALLHCDAIHFDSVYVLFIKFAEKTGKLEKVFTFLKARCERKNQNIQRVVEASVYPVFVIVMVIVFCVLFLCFGKTLSGNFPVLDSDAKGQLCSEMFFLCVFCGITYWFFWKNMKENKLYEAFLGIDFLIKAGVNVSLAVGYGMLLVGPDSRLGAVFSEAQKRLEYGMDLRASFGVSNDGGGKFSDGIDKKIADAFYFAQQAGESSDVFEKIAKNLNAADEKKRKICLSLVEPMLIAVTGIFLLILTANFLLPVFTSTNIIKT